MAWLSIAPFSRSCLSCYFFLLLCCSSLVVSCSTADVSCTCSLFFFLPALSPAVLLLDSRSYLAPNFPLVVVADLRAGLAFCLGVSHLIRSSIVLSWLFFFFYLLLWLLYFCPFLGLILLLGLFFHPSSCSLNSSPLLCFISPFSYFPSLLLLMDPVPIPHVFHSFVFLVLRSLLLPLPMFISEFIILISFYRFSLLFSLFVFYVLPSCTWPFFLVHPFLFP